MTQRAAWQAVGRGGVAGFQESSAPGQNTAFLPGEHRNGIISSIAGVEFEFDPEKSTANKVKDGIDFVEAQALWLDAALIEAPARMNDEPRGFSS
jgi:hypothetical protein